MTPGDKLEQMDLDSFCGDVLVVTPLYPKPENKYLCAFVHSRVQTYLAAGLSVDVASCAFDGRCSRYEFEGVTVNCIPLDDLQMLLRHRTYRVIAVHFLEPAYARVLESCDLHDSHILIWAHGAETLYWDRPVFASRYFSRPYVFGPDETADCKNRDAILRRFNQMPNVTFVFVSDFVKKRSEELTGITWNDGRVIHNPVDLDLFAYREKDVELRKKVFCARKFDNYSSYAMDIVTRTILELSRRPCFSDMEFTLVGTGEAHEMLTAPLRRFENVHLIDRYLSHEELAQLHRENGVALFPTRFDAQGVSMCEAAASGLAVVSTKRDSVAAFLPGDKGLLADTEDYVGYADIVEHLHDDPAFFHAASIACHEKVARKCSYENTTKRELALFEEKQEGRVPPTCASDGQPPLLTLLVLTDDEQASRPFEQLRRLMNLPQLETVCAPSLAQGIDGTKGRYCKILGPDDFLDPDALRGLMGYLTTAKESTVLTDYLELAPRTGMPTECGHFDFMSPEQAYGLADLMYPGFGFDDRTPNRNTGVFLTEYLRKALALVPESPLSPLDSNIRAILCAKECSYYPHVVWHHHRADAEHGELELRDQVDALAQIIAEVGPQEAITASPRAYVLERLVSPWISRTYDRLVKSGDGKLFEQFDHSLSAVPELYGKPELVSDEVAFHRRTKCRFISQPGLTDKMVRAYRTVRR